MKNIKCKKYEIWFIGKSFHSGFYKFQVGCILGGLIGSLRGLYKGRSLKSMIAVAYKVIIHF